MLYHVSEEPDIARFEPRPSAVAAEPVVWAVEEARLCNYLLPRDCPRVTFYAGPNTADEDLARFLGLRRAVVAIESIWLEPARSRRLYCYRMPPQTFECFDACAGYFVSRQAVVAAGVEVIDDPLRKLAESGAHLQIFDNLWPLRDAVLASSLQFSFLRMRNAAPRASGPTGPPSFLHR